MCLSALQAQESSKPSPEENVDAIDVSAEEADGVGGLSSYVLETEEVVWHLRGPSHLTSSVQTQHQQIHDQAIVLHDERGKLQASDDPVGICVVHILERKNCNSEQLSMVS